MDYISRDEAVEKIRYIVCQGHGNKEHICKIGSCAYCGIMEIMSDISSIEAADVQPVKHGRWINIYFGDECSECGYGIGRTSKIYKCNYCPNCGAKMIKDGELK